MTDHSEDRLDAAVDEAAALRNAVDALAASIVSAVPKEESRFKTLAVLAIIGGPLLFVLTMGFGVYVYRAQNDTIKELREGNACVLADLDDHRHTNQDAHTKIAEGVANPVQVIQPDLTPLTPEQAAKLKQYCEPYVKKVVGQTIGLSGGPVRSGGVARGR